MEGRFLIFLVPPPPGGPRVRTVIFLGRLLILGRFRRGSKGLFIFNLYFDLKYTLCYAIVLPGRKSAFRAGFWSDRYRENTDIGPPAGLRPAGGPMSVSSR